MRYSIGDMVTLTAQQAWQLNFANHFDLKSALIVGAVIFLLMMTNVTKA